MMTQLPADHPSAIRARRETLFALKPLRVRQNVRSKAFVVDKPDPRRGALLSKAERAHWWFETVSLGGKDQLVYRASSEPGMRAERARLWEPQKLGPGKTWRMDWRDFNRRSGLASRFSCRIFCCHATPII